MTGSDLVCDIDLSQQNDRDIDLPMTNFCPEMGSWEGRCFAKISKLLRACSGSLLFLIHGGMRFSLSSQSRFGVRQGPASI
jgi:hypothetical protein